MFTGVAESERSIGQNALLVPHIAERALTYLYAEANLVSVEQLRALVARLELDSLFIERTLDANKRPLRLR